MLLTAGSCKHSRPVNLTSDRGLIELSFVSSMSRSSSKTTLHFDCRWLIQPSTSHTSVVLQFLSLRLFGSGARSSAASSTKSSCSENFVEVRVGRNLVSRCILLFYSVTLILWYCRLGITKVLWLTRLLRYVTVILDLLSFIFFSIRPHIFLLTEWWDWIDDVTLWFVIHILSQYTV